MTLTLQPAAGTVDLGTAAQAEVERRVQQKLAAEEAAKKIG